jgi:Peptidase S24-like
MNIVTQRFVQCFHRLVADGKVRSGRTFAKKMDYLPQSWSEVVKDRRDVTIEVIRKAIEVYGINPIYLFTGEGDFFIENDILGGYKLMTVLSAEKGEQLLVYVPKETHQIYVENANTPAFLSSLPRFTLPDFNYKEGNFRAFEVAGDAMEHGLHEGDKVIASFIEPDFWISGLKDNHVYVLVTRADVLIKRIKNRLNDLGELTLISDNSYYDTYQMSGSELREVWQVRQKISPLLNTRPSEQGQIVDQIKVLQDTIRAQSKMMDHLSYKVQQLAGK